MNKLDTSQATTTKGQPLLAGSFNWFQLSTIEMIKGMVESMITEELQALSTTVGIAVSYCEDTAGIISSGFMYYQGELYALDGDDTTGYSNIPVVRANNNNGGLDPITFSDGSTGNVHNIRRLGIYDGVTGSGLFDYSAVKFLNNYRLQTKVIEIGDWDMDTTASVSVAHGLTSTDIRSVDVWIREDTGAVMVPLNYNQSGTPSGYFIYGSTNVDLTRVAAGLFDTASYNATSFNRGFITIQYVGW